MNTTAMSALNPGQRARRNVRVAVAIAVVTGIAAVFVGAACASPSWQAMFSAGVPVDTGAPFLKCHIFGGDVYVLERWSADPQARTVTGAGLHYDGERRIVDRGAFTLPFDDVHLFETNRPETLVHTGVAVMGVLTTASVAFSTLCLTVPKACFGSCPTFYVKDGDTPVLQAEGFSEAIAPSLTKTDLDALYLARPGVVGGPFDLRMTNEAVETHVVDSVRLIAVPRPPGGRVLQTRHGALHAATSLTGPRTCHGAAGDCLKAVTAVDDVEYRSLADDGDLAAREVMELTFPRPQGGGRVGVVVRGRNTLLNTYLFYQTLAWAGTSAGDWLMRLERGGEKARDLFGGQGAALGDVVVSVFVDGRWVEAGEFAEVGPIAKETQLVVLPEALGDGPELRVRLTMTQGNWRVDHVAAAALVDVAAAIPLVPQRVTHAGVDDKDALARLTGPGSLVTYPGDDYTMTFSLPGGDVELFLESRGYYLEWIRHEWLAEQDEGRMIDLLRAPDDTLKKLAPAYKKVEPAMETVFWQSGFSR